MPFTPRIYHSHCPAVSDELWILKNISIPGPSLGIKFETNLERTEKHSRSHMLGCLYSV